MNVLIDNAMPYWQDYFNEVYFEDVEHFRAGQLNLPKYKRVQALLVRSTTKVDANLLDKFPNLMFVGTATAGYDHIDCNELHRRNIAFERATACNAASVAQYVVSALLSIATKDDFLLKDKSIAIVGAGSVGSMVGEILSTFTDKVILYDPPKKHGRTHQPMTNSKDYADFEEVLDADIISIHAALDSDFMHPSRHLFDRDALLNLDKNQILINAARGEIVDAQALVDINKQKPNSLPKLVFDVWENEPYFNSYTIDLCEIATPHIAGHSIEGKSIGTEMMFEALTNFMMSENLVEPLVVKKKSIRTLLPDTSNSLSFRSDIQDRLNDTSITNLNEIQSLVHEVCSEVYDIRNDDSVFRHYMAQSRSFAGLRQNYPIRREFSSIKVDVNNINIRNILRGLGFIISNDSEIPNLNR